MTYHDDPQQTAATPPGIGMGFAVHAVGAVLSLSLVIGLVVWGVHQMRRDVSGVPVIQALAEPMRERPVNPGGAQAAHQGLAVNAVQEGAGAEELAEAVTLAPAPVTIQPEDIEAIDAARLTANGSGSEGAAGAPPDMQAAIDRLVAMAEPLEPLDPLAEDAAVEVEPMPEGIGVTRSPRPLARPADLRAGFEAAAAATAAREQAAAAQAAASDGQGQAVVSSESTPEALVGAIVEAARTGAALDLAAALPGAVDPTSLAAGTRLVQLGAYDDAETARSEWTRLTAAFPDFFQGRAPIVQEAVSGGRPFYRLRAHGFADYSDASRFCTALLAEGAACIPVTVR